jgi:hypothetical protein
MPAKPGTAKTTKKSTNGNATALSNGESTARRPSQKATTASIAMVSSDAQDQIRRRAYELYVQRGRLDGYDEQDWLQAEAELTSRSA